jgi:uncharacterized integral membrane protein
MRTVIAFFVGIVTAAVVAGLGVLVVQDTQSEQLTFLGITMSAARGVVMTGAVAVGFVLAVLLLLPGRIASAWHRARIRQQTRALEERLRALREEHAQLHGGHQRLVVEHGLVLDRVLPSPQGSRSAAASPSGQTPHAPQASSQPVSATNEQVQPAAREEAVAQPTGALSR